MRVSYGSQSVVADDGGGGGSHAPSLGSGLRRGDGAVGSNLHRNDGLVGSFSTMIPA